MRLSTFLILATVVAIALMIVKSNPAENLLPFLSRESAPPQQASGQSSASTPEPEKRFLLAGRIVRRFRDGHIIVSGSVTQAGNGASTGGQFALVGRTDSNFLTDGSPINCEVSPDGDYQFQSGGFMQTVKQFVAAGSTPGASRAAAWMDEGNPLDRGSYHR